MNFNVFAIPIVLPKNATLLYMEVSFGIIAPVQISTDSL